MTRNSVAENLTAWDLGHGWPEDGDEWKGQAAACGVPYEVWKQSLIDHLIAPFVPDGAAVLEIGPGHGRWSEPLAARAGRLILLDLSPRCLDHCRQRFAGRTHVELRLGNGSSLPDDLDGALDLAWSFDTFVHIAPAEIGSYLRHIHRVLKPGGTCVIHHANRFHGTLWLAPLRRLGPRGTKVYRALSIGMEERADGWRSPVSRRLFARLARDAGLAVVDQFNRWGDGSCGVPRHNDCITLMRKPR